MRKQHLLGKFRRRAGAARADFAHPELDDEAGQAAIKTSRHAA
jgi:hypothetical protein